MLRATKAGCRRENMTTHLSPDTRQQIVKAVRRCNNKSLVARVFGVSRKTVTTWYERAHHRGSESFRDRRPEPKRTKITDVVESAILGMRVLFNWGSARIEQGLESLPAYAAEAVEKIIGCALPQVRLSRTAINEVLQKHHLNGYPAQKDSWKFFRAQRADELWQLDLKGPFTVSGKKFYIAVCMDDYSRFLILCELFAHCPATEEITELLSAYVRRTNRKPEKILTDRGGQFQERWTHWCGKHGVEALFAHPHYPQDKGKVERMIRNVADEFVKLLKKFPEWLCRLGEYMPWYNEKRLHRGVWDYPAKLYKAGSG